MSQDVRVQFVYAYCHGFLSKHYDLPLHMLDLNAGDPANLSFQNGFDAIDKLWETECNKLSGASIIKLRLLGSSFGGQVTALYAAAHPQRVDKMVLLCPAVNTHAIISRIAESVRPDAVQIWKQQGYFNFSAPGTKNKKISVPYSFLKQCKKYPPYPNYICSTLLIEARLDTVVSPEDISQFLKECPEQAKCSEAIMVEDDHGLTGPNTLELIEAEIAKFFNLYDGLEIIHR